ncbi:MAG TPA: hypothetical protein DD990_13195 [Cyanobacteria bacterium UBA11368]|nr:hypothetical protein [Cyanobacteria bacterium UBA11368]
MFTFKRWQSKTALIMAFAMTGATATPFMAAAPVLAETRIAQSQRFVDFRIPTGTVIPVSYDKEKIVVAPNETAQLTLTVAQDIVSRDKRTVIVPRGSEIVGQLQPVRGGSQFVARELRIADNRPQSINASSRVVTTTQEVRRGPNARNILIGAAAGSGAAAAIAGLTGDRRINPLEVLIGTGVGAAGGLLVGQNRSSTRVVVIDPDSDLDLTLRSDLVVRGLGYNTGLDRGFDPNDRGI